MMAKKLNFKFFMKIKRAFFRYDNFQIVDDWCVCVCVLDCVLLELDSMKNPMISPIYLSFQNWIARLLDVDISNSLSLLLFWGSCRFDEK